MIESVDMYIRNMEGPHLTVPDVKMADTKFNLKIANFNKKPWMSFSLYTYRCTYSMLFNVKYYSRLSVLRWSLVQIKPWIWKISSFVFIFAYSITSHAISLYVCDLSFLKIILEIILMGFYNAKYTCYFFIISKQNGCLFPILRLSLYSHIQPLFVHATCAIYIINVFYCVNLNLSTVTNNHKIQKMDQK